MHERSKENREKLTKFYVSCPESLPELIEGMLGAPYPENFFHAWVWDGVIQTGLDTAWPFLPELLPRLKQTNCEGVIRSLAKTCERVSEQLSVDGPESERPPIDPDLLEAMVSSCFDWLQGEHKVASKVFAMSTLWNLRHLGDWIEEELIEELRLQLPTASPGFRSRAVKILNMSLHTD